MQTHNNITPHASKVGMWKPATAIEAIVRMETSPIYIPKFERNAVEAREWLEQQPETVRNFVGQQITTVLDAYNEPDEKTGISPAEHNYALLYGNR